MEEGKKKGIRERSKGKENIGKARKIDLSKVRKENRRER